MSFSLLRALFVGAVCSVAVSSVASAQAWVNPKGELQLQLHSDYQFSTGVWHGKYGLITGLPVNSFNESISAEYVPIDNLALELTQYANGVKFGASDLTSSDNFPVRHGSQDDGTRHWNLTDLELEARYQAYDGPVTLTPIAHVRVPVTDYENKGYGAAGSGLEEVGAGLRFGKYGLGLEDLVFQIGYQFTYVSKYDDGGKYTEQYRVNRSDADMSFSYVINEKAIVGAGAVFRYTHDGFQLDQYGTVLMDKMNTLPLFHDPVLQVAYLAPVAIGSYQLNRNWSLLGRFAAVVWGANTSNPISFGVTLGYAANVLE